MYLDLYKINGTINLDQDSCFTKGDTYPTFQEELEVFKESLTQMVNNKECKTFYKFGDGDYYFLRGQSFGSAGIGRRAIGKPYNQINHQDFKDGAILNDYYTCEIYPKNRQLFHAVMPSIKLDYPAEFVYGLVSNKWLFKTFNGKIGIIGASEKIDLVKDLMKHEKYQEYLGLDKFNDYIKIPQKFACDDLDATEKMIGEQLKNSNSDIFLLGIGHVKSGLLHRLKKYKKAIYLDIGSGVDAIAGIIDVGRPFFGDWTNYQIKDKQLNGIDFLAYNGQGKHLYL